MSHYFYFENNSQVGPVGLEEMLKHITPDTEVWTQGMTEWTAAKNVPEVAAALGLATAQADAQPAGQPSEATTTSDTSDTTETLTAGTDSADYSASSDNATANSASGSQPANPKIKEDAKLFTILSFISILVCCNSVGGIIAGVYGIISEVYYNQGNFAEAEQKLRAAKIWFFVTVGFMVLCWVLYIAFYGVLLSSMSGAFNNLK